MKSTLQTLGMLHMVWGGFLGLAALLLAALGVLSALGVMALAGLMSGTDGGADGATVLAIGGFFQGATGVLLGAVLGGLALVHVLAGRWIRAGRARGYGWGLVSSCCMLISMPFGTALGIWTILMLLKPEARYELSG